MGPLRRPPSRASPSAVDRGDLSPVTVGPWGIPEVPAGPRLVDEPAAPSPTDLLFLHVGALGPFPAGSRVSPTRERPVPWRSALTPSHFRPVTVPGLLRAEGPAVNFGVRGGDRELRR